MAEVHLRKGDLVKRKDNQEVGVLMAIEGQKAVVFWGNGLCSYGPIDELEAILFSPQAQITASFIELVDSFNLGKVWLREGSPGSGRFA